MQRNFFPVINRFSRKHKTIERPPQSVKKQTKQNQQIISSTQEPSNVEVFLNDSDVSECNIFTYNNLAETDTLIFLRSYLTNKQPTQTQNLETQVESKLNEISLLLNQNTKLRVAINISKKNQTQLQIQKNNLLLHQHNKTTQEMETRLKSILEGNHV